MGYIVWGVWVLMGFLAYGLMKGFWVNYFKRAYMNGKYWKDWREELLWIMCGAVGPVGLFLAFCFTFLEGDKKLRFLLFV